MSAASKLDRIVESRVDANAVRPGSFSVASMVGEGPADVASMSTFREMPSLATVIC